MDEVEKISEQSETRDASKSYVGFPEVTRPKKKSFGALILVILALIIAGFFVYSLVWGGETKDKFMKNDTETVTGDKVSEVSTPTPTEKVLSKKDLKVKILNGSGVVGSASELQKKIAALGFLSITTGNADNYDYKTTEVAFSPAVSDEIQTEVLTELKKTYSSVTSEEKAVTGFDIQIIIGGKSTASPTPITIKSSVTPTKTPTPSSGTTTPSITPTI